MNNVYLEISILKHQRRKFSSRTLKKNNNKKKKSKWICKWMLPQHLSNLIISLNCHLIFTSLFCLTLCKCQPFSVLKSEVTLWLWNQSCCRCSTGVVMLIRDTFPPSKIAFNCFFLWGVINSTKLIPSHQESLMKLASTEAGSQSSLYQDMPFWVWKSVLQC